MPTNYEYDEASETWPVLHFNGDLDGRRAYDTASNIPNFFLGPMLKMGIQGRVRSLMRKFSRT